MSREGEGERNSNPHPAPSEILLSAARVLVEPTTTTTPHAPAGRPAPATLPTPYVSPAPTPPTAPRPARGVTHLAAAVALARVQAGMNQQDFADAVGMGLRTLERMERAKAPGTVDLRVLARIAEATGTDPRWFAAAMARDMGA